MRVLRIAVFMLLVSSLSAPATEPRFPLTVQQTSENQGRPGGLRQIIPGHYVYLHTDDTPLKARVPTP